MKRETVTGYTVWIFMGILLCGTAVVFAQEEVEQKEKKAADLSVQQIVDQANWASYYKGKDGRAKVTMDIIDSQGRKRNREFTILRRDEPAPEDAKDEKYCGDQKFYVYFSRPADVSKMVFMVWKHVDKDDDRWLYMPALDLVKRVAASDKRTSFVGSHFFYEDVSGRGVDEDKHELVETTDNYYVLKNTPKKPGEVEFAWYKMWIHKKSFLPVKTEYYDSNGKAYRRYTVTKVEDLQGFQTVTGSVMEDLKSGGKTEMTYESVKYNLGIPEDIFTERYLRRAPRKYLR